MIQIMRETPSRFLVEDAASLEGEKWDEKLEKVSLTGESETVLLGEPQECPTLSTLLFFDTNKLTTISEDFFTQMKALRVLDISNTRLAALPGSACGLENLAVLLLRNCRWLESVPDMSRLRNLIRLDLNGSNISDYPEGLEKLERLRHLDLGGIWTWNYPKGLLLGLPNLIYLSIIFIHRAGIETASELASLQNLETLRVAFQDNRLSNAYLRIATPPLDFTYGVGSLDSDAKTPKTAFLYKAMRDDLVLLPDHVETICVLGCERKSLCRLASFENLERLKRLVIAQCVYVEYIVHPSPTMSPLLRFVTDLDLHWLHSLRALVGPASDGTPSSTLPLGAFSSLRSLRVYGCPNLSTVLAVGKQASFPALEKVHIELCHQLEDMISYESRDALLVNLPALKTLKLLCLPKLKTALFSAESLSSACIRKCPHLEYVASSLLPFLHLQHLSTQSDSEDE